jgi:hypothetical protein
MNNLWMRLIQKKNELLQKLKAWLPGAAKALLAAWISLILCAIIGGLAMDLLRLEAGGNLHLLVNTASGAWLYPWINKGLGKLIGRS